MIFLKIISDTLSHFFNTARVRDAGAPVFLNNQTHIFKNHPKNSFPFSVKKGSCAEDFSLKKTVFPPETPSPQISAGTALRVFVLRGKDSAISPVTAMRKSE